MKFGDCLVFGSSSCYYFSDDTRTYEDAKTFCGNKRRMGRLVEIDSMEEMTFLMSVLLQKDADQTREYVIGEKRTQSTFG